MNIQSILDRAEDRIFEIVKSWATGNHNVDSLEFDIDLLDKDIELIKELIKTERKKREHQC